MEVLSFFGNGGHREGVLKTHEAAGPEGLSQVIVQI